MGAMPGDPQMDRTEQNLSRLEKACVDKGLRMTEQRRIIARVVAEAYDHPDAEELYRRAIAVDPHISIATVYRTVKLFEDAGILERHDFRDGRSRCGGIGFRTRGSPARALWDPQGRQETRSPREIDDGGLSRELAIMSKLRA